MFSLFGAILLRSESAASSRIENLTASAKSIALAELGDTSRRNATEIVANTAAMTAAIALADRLDATAILAMHAALLDENDPKISGRWRTAQVWIGSSNYGPHTASFVPPHHSRVTAAIDDLVRRRPCSVRLTRSPIEPVAGARDNGAVSALLTCRRGDGVTRDWQARRVG